MKTAAPDSSSGARPDGASARIAQSLLDALQPPAWVVDEVQNRVVLFLNHVLMQEKVAQERLRRQKGKPVRLQWGAFHLTLAATPAGLLERTAQDAAPELSVTVAHGSPWDLLQRVLGGDKPAVDIRGDVQLAAEVAWLVDNVRWDIEEDLSRWVGDAAAHTLVRMARSAAQGLRQFVGRMPSEFAARAPFGPGVPSGGSGAHSSESLRTGPAA